MGVGGIDGEPVGRGFGEVERNKDHARLHPLGDEGGQLDMATAAGDFHLFAVADAQPLRINHAHHHPRASQLVEPLGLAGHGAGVELLQQAAGSEHDGIGLVGQFGGIAERGRDHLPLATGELLGVEQASAFGRRIVAGPLQPLRSHLVPLDAGVLRGDLADLGGDLLRVLIVPVAPHGVGDLLDDPPILPRLTRCLEGGGDALHSPFGVGEVAALLGKGAGGEHHIGQLCGFREEDILHHQKLQLLEPLDDVMLIRIAQHRVFPHHIEPLDAARTGGIDGLGKSEAGRTRQVRLLPGCHEAGMYLWVGHLLIAGQAVGQRPHVTGALHVGLAPQRVDATPLNADVAAQQLQVGDGAHVVVAGGVLGDPHGVVDGGAFGGADEARELDHLLGRYAGDEGHLVRGIGGGEHLCLQFLEPFHPRGDIGLVVPVVLDDLLHQAVEQHHVGAGAVGQIEAGMVRHLDPLGIGHYQPRLAHGYGPLDMGADDGVGRRCVGADDEDEIRVVDARDVVGHGAAAE